MATSLTDMISGASDVALYSSIRSYVSTRIDFFLEHTLSGMLTIMGLIAISLFTLWIIIQGFMIMSGRSQDGLRGFITSALRNYLIIVVATGLAATTDFSVRKLTDDLTSSVAEVMAGDSDVAKCLGADGAFLGCKIDRNLIVMQAAMNFAGQLDTADDPVLEDKKTRASYFIGIGTAGPAVIAGTMLLMYKVAMALFIGFGPLFILCLLFKQTSQLFSKWLYYGIATIFSSMLLAVMADISMDLVMNVAGALFVTDLFVSNQGIMQAATQQLGLGVMLSLLLITVPPMAGNFFSGTLGAFAAYNQFGTGMPAAGSAAGQSGAYGNHGAQGAQGVSGSGGSTTPVNTGNNENYNPAMRTSTGQTNLAQSSDTVKTVDQTQTGVANARSYSPTPTAVADAPASAPAVTEHRVPPPPKA